MEYFKELIEHLPERHRTALSWFFGNVGTEQRWPNPLPDGTFLVSKAQGIYKPKWTKYCLSIRQNLGSKYTDKEPEVRSDGTWSFLYAQEATNPQSRDADYANRSMVSCMHDRVPIGVMRQITEVPISRYHILGTALVVGRYEGHFHIEGFSVDGLARGVGSPMDLGHIIVSQEKLAELTGAFSPNDIIDAREKTLASIIRRRGQPTFRQKMLAAYNGECAITGCNVEEALDGALQEVRTNRQVIQDRIKDLEKAMISEDEKRRRLNDVTEILDILRRNIRDASFETKQKVCGLLVKEIRVGKNEEGITTLNIVYYFNKDWIQGDPKFELLTARAGVHRYFGALTFYYTGL